MIVLQNFHNFPQFHLPKKTIFGLAFCLFLLVNFVAAHPGLVVESKSAQKGKGKLHKKWHTLNCQYCTGVPLCFLPPVKPIYWLAFLGCTCAALPTK